MTRARTDLEVAKPRWLSAMQVRARLGLSTSAFHRLRSCGNEFPAPVRLNRVKPMWSLAEIEAWEAQRLADRGVTP